MRPPRKRRSSARWICSTFMAGRNNRARWKSAVWQREATYSTGFGHGFAIPHCKTSAVQANSLVLLKLRQPVDVGFHRWRAGTAWSSSGDSRFQGGSEHMKIISTLARQVMHEEFRARLEQARDAGCTRAPSSKTTWDCEWV